MPTPTAPFVRQFGPNAKGPDVEAVKRALVKAGKGAGVNTKTDTFGVAAQKQLVAFKEMCKLDADPIYTAETHGFLAPYFDAHGIELLEQEAAAVAKTEKRDRFLSIADLTVAHHTLFTYSEVLGEEPGERDYWRVAPLVWDGSVHFSCDCSGHYIGCGEHAGIPISVAKGVMDSDGATGALLDALTRITAAEAQPGDGVIFVGPNAPAGHHITMLREKLPNADFRVINMGGPGEPSGTTTLSEQAAYQTWEGYETLVYVQLPT